MLTVAFLSAIGDFLESSQLQIVYWAMALAGTVVFGAFFALTIMGFGSLHDVAAGADGSIPDHADTGYSDFKLISIRSVLAFMTFFGWGGVLWGKYGWTGFFGSIALGLAMMFITAGLLFVILKLQHSGNVKSDDFIGHRGTVYVSIPAGRAAAGKVTIAIGGYTSEIVAVSDEALATGATVEVLERLDERRFLVKKA